jgi:hypothetical protein
MRFLDDCPYCKNCLPDEKCGVRENQNSIYPCPKKDTDEDKELEALVHGGTI